MITFDYLKSLDIDSRRHKDFLINYSNKRLSLEEFLNSEKITHSYKVSIFTRQISKNVLRNLGIKFAKSAIYVYELHNKNDLTLCKIIKKYENSSNKLNKNDPTLIKLLDLANSQTKNSSYAAVKSLYCAMLSNLEMASWYAIQAVFEENFLPCQKNIIKEVIEEQKKQIELMKQTI